MNAKHYKLVERVWAIFITVAAIALLFLTFEKDFSLADKFAGSAWLYVILIAMAFFAEYVDSSLGMGYGTVLTPVLLIMGFSPLQVVPCILCSEFLTGTFAGAMHHRLGNVNLSNGTEARGIVKTLLTCSVIGTVLAVAIALNLPPAALKTYIGVMLLSIGVFILVGKDIFGAYSQKKIVGLGMLAAFNKGISGGGYGPLVTGGQVILGVPEKQAVGITSLTEGLVCAVGLTLYCVFNGFPALGLALPLTLGGLLSVPLAAWTVKVLPARMIRHSISYATIFLGSLSLLKVAM